MVASVLNPALAAIAKMIRDAGGRVRDAVIEMPRSVLEDLKREGAEQHSVVFRDGRKIDTLHGMPVAIVQEQEAPQSLAAPEDD